MKDLRVAYYVLEFEIHRDREKGGIKSITKGYMPNILKKFNMQACNCTPYLVVKGGNFENDQGSRNQYEIDRMNQFHMIQLSEA